MKPSDQELSPAERKFLSQFDMGRGAGSFQSGKACVMACAVALHRFRLGEPLSITADYLECVCPVLRRLSIRLNDGDWWPGGNEERTKTLMPLVPKLLNTSNPVKTQVRLFRAVDWLLREIVPLENPKGISAKELTSLAPIKDEKTAYAASNLASYLRTRGLDTTAYLAVRSLVFNESSDLVAIQVGLCVSHTASMVSKDGEAYYDRCKRRTEFRKPLEALIEELLAI